MPQLCVVPGCPRSARGQHGWCNAHYKRWVRTGDVVASHPIGTLNPRIPCTDPVERFWRLVDRSAGPHACWPWLGTIIPRGYGRFRYKTAAGRWQNLLAHRFAYEVTYGMIEPEKEIDHLCHTTACISNPCPHRHCVNPAHLHMTSHLENVRRGHARYNIKKASAARTAQQRAQTHCKYGHAWTAENTRRSPQGTRQCRACGRMHNLITRYFAHANSATQGAL